MASTLTSQKSTPFFAGRHGKLREKKAYFRKKLRNRNFFGTEIVGIVTDSAFRISRWKGGTKLFLLCFGRPKSVEGDKMRSVSKNMRCRKKVYPTIFQKRACPLGWSDLSGQALYRKLWKIHFFCNTAIFILSRLDYRHLDYKPSGLHPIRLPMTFGLLTFGLHPK